MVMRKPSSARSFRRTLKCGPSVLWNGSQMEGDTPEQHSAHDALSSRGVWPHAMQTVPSVQFEYGVIMWTRFVKTECGLGL